MLVIVTLNSIIQKFYETGIADKTNNLSNNVKHLNILASIIKEMYRNVYEHSENLFDWDVSQAI